MSIDWSTLEIQLIIKDYFQMLKLEIQGQPYKKSEYRKTLLPKLNNRSEGAIEFKHQNISAILLEYNLPYIIGYKPRSNYQSLLEELVIDYLNQETDLDKLFLEFSRGEKVKPPRIIDYSKLIVDLPEKISSSKKLVTKRSSRIRKLNYLEIEQNNTKLGMLGEELIIFYEKWRLVNSGKEKFAEQVEWISKEQGDGAGFDILSKNSNGTDRYIEVKTTKLGEFTPFFFSRNELLFSRKQSTHYFLYRVFKFNSDPKIFVKPGSFDEICTYEPTNYIGTIRAGDL